MLKFKLLVVLFTKLVHMYITSMTTDLMRTPLALEL
jgi:hypothetical protein